MTSNLYILWDWNGTLLDDVDAQVASLNAMLTRRGHRPVTRQFFCDNFAFPARTFYRLVGMDVPDSEWDALAKEYHDTYHAQSYGLNRGAFAALELVKQKGAGQSVISALHQFYLDLETNKYGVQPFMDHIYGVDNLDGGSKLSRARELLASLRAITSPTPTPTSTSTPSPTSSSLPTTTTSNYNYTLIGDSIHDFEVAKELGIRCVLYSGGSHSRARLEHFAPVGDTLVECVQLALKFV